MARKGDLVTVKWQDAEHCEDVELTQNWSKYKPTVHMSTGIIQYNGRRLLVISSSKEAGTTQGDVYTIPKDKWLLGMEIIKTKGQLK